MAFELFSKVALKVDVPSHKLRKGDVATIVEAHTGRSAVGETIAVITVRESQIEPLTNNEVLHVRRLDEVPS